MSVRRVSWSCLQRLGALAERPRLHGRLRLTFCANTARDFINRCLVIDQTKRMTATEALAHPWLAQLAPTASATAQAQRPDLLPSLRKNFNAKGTWKRAIMGVRAAGALKAGGEARRATLLAEATGTDEERQRVFESAQRAKKEAEEEAVSRHHSAFAVHAVADPDCPQNQVESASVFAY